MNENPYLTPHATSEHSLFRKALPHDVLQASLVGLAVAFVLYGLETLTDIGISLAYSFPSFYPLRGIIYFNPLLGFSLQCLIYGIAIGFAIRRSRDQPQIETQSLMNVSLKAIVVLPILLDGIMVLASNVPAPAAESRNREMHGSNGRSA